MTGPELTAASLLLAGASLLVVAGSGHLRHPQVFAAGIRRHGILPRAWAARIVRPLAVTEILAGAGVLAAWVMALPVTVPAAALVTLYVGFTIYTAAAVRATPGAACACFASGEPLTWAVPIRALVLGIGSIPALMTVPPHEAGARVTIAAAGGVVALIAWALPVVTGLGCGSEHGLSHHRQ